MNKRYKAGILAVVVLLGACSSNQSEPTDASPSVITVQVGQTFELKPGQTAQLGQLQIAFRGVSQDSRCPSDVQCVWAGDATVRINAAYARMAWQPFDLHTGVEPRSARYRDNTITVVELKPGTHSGRQIAASDYVLTLRVD